MVFHNFIVEDGEVESEAKFNGIAWGEGNLVGFVVCLERVLLHLFKKAALSVFSDVTIVITDHLDEKSLGFTITLLGKNVIADHIDDLLAVTGEFGLNALFVASKSLGVLGVLGVLLNCSNCAASSALRTDEVLESDR